MTPGSFGIRHPVLRVGLGECLLAADRPEEALLELDAALAGLRDRQDLWCEPELVRLRGVALLAAGVPDAQAAAIREFRRAVDLARRQSAVSWELRAATSLAGLLARMGHAEVAHDTLNTAIAGFTEGFQTADLVAAMAMMHALAGEA